MTGKRNAIRLAGLVMMCLALSARSSPDEPVAQPLPLTMTKSCRYRVDASPPAGACLPGVEALSLRKSRVTALPAARKDRPYLYRFQPQGGKPPYRFLEVGEGLPAGILLTQDGNVVGNSGSAGRHEFTVELRDQSGQVLRQRFSLSVTEPKPRPRPASTPAASAPAQRVIEALPDRSAGAILAPQDVFVSYLLGQSTLASIKPGKPKPAGNASDAKADEAPSLAASAPATAPPRPVPAARMMLPIGPAGSLIPLANIDPTAPLPGDDPDEFGVMQATAPVRAAPITVKPPPKPAIPEEPGIGELSEAAVAQLRQILTPLVGVEYPGRDLFAAALDAKVCRFAAELTNRAAQEKRLASPTPRQWQTLCRTAWLTPRAAPPVVVPPGHVSWRDLPRRLMPPKVRAWLIDAARQTHPFRPAAVPAWRATGCNCLMSAQQGKVVGFFPGWHLPPKSLPLDFSLYERILTLAQPFDEEGHVTPLKPGAEELEFFRAVRRFGSKLDLTLYRRDWVFLRRLSEAKRALIAQTAAAEARLLADTPLERFGANWQDRVPGNGAARLADGIVLYLDQIPAPGDDGYAEFDAFRDALIKALIEELRKGGRAYTLSLVVNGNDLLGLRQADKPGQTGAPAWTIDKLFSYLLLAEDPRIDNRRILAGKNGETGRTNLTLHYVVLLPEPVNDTKKALRELAELSPALPGNNRRVFLRKVLPLVSLGSVPEQPLKDDMAYFSDNFGGMALWPKPEADAKLAAFFAQSVQSVILGNESPETPVCTVVCDWRWPLRALFGLFLAAGLVSLLLYAVSCRVRALGRPYQLYLIAIAIVPIVIGTLLMSCDPDLVRLGLSTYLLVAVLAAVILSLLIPLLKPKVEKP
ncbi:putative Ig domain-containing protein [Paludibacterium paludis]|uniref:Uncharacterized protein n=1 Tax=Paludibacterium paludis TaxID=1225769 RepID=A0A918P274_9NEIS|nr:putative Ig domain-containing protein [Paludibacterium paludis]GGY13901.1 hypothetical protein GCM10011289_16570 [Paludibacterium paludis]